MLNTPEEILSWGRIIKVDRYDFMPKQYADQAVEAARLEVAEFFVNLSGIFGHYEFFTKELWRKVPGFKKEDKAEVIAAFLHYWFHNKFKDFYTCTCGSGWFASLGKECYEGYIEKYKPVFEAYANWYEKQR